MFWDDVITIDNVKQEMIEIGCNVNLREKGKVTDTSRWYASPSQPEETLYTKTVRQLQYLTLTVVVLLLHQVYCTMLETSCKPSAPAYICDAYELMRIALCSQLELHTVAETL